MSISVDSRIRLKSSSGPVFRSAGMAVGEFSGGLQARPERDDRRRETLDEASNAGRHRLLRHT
jgi:hypothetical protein